jgi:hypothetical protein
VAASPWKISTATFPSPPSWVAQACGADLKFAIEQSIGGTFHSDPGLWTGGWMFGYSGLTMDVDGCSGFMGATPVNPAPLTFADRYRPWSTARGTNIKVNGVAIDDLDIYDNRATINGVANPTFQKCLSGDGSDTPHDGYTVTGYWYADDKTTINNCNPCRGRTIQVMMNDGASFRSPARARLLQCPTAWMCWMLARPWSGICVETWVA